MKNGLARLVSILGHPALVMPVIAIITDSRNKDSTITLMAPLLAALCALVIMIYSFCKTKAGQWVHIDASGKQERSELNLFAILLLFLVTIGLAYFQVDRNILFVTGISAGLIFVAHLLQKYMKPSMHVAFALLATGIVWPIFWMVATLALLSIALMWSRLVLSRHTPSDVIVGTVLGLVGGSVYRLALH